MRYVTIWNFLLYLFLARYFKDVDLYTKGNVKTCQ